MHYLQCNQMEEFSVLNLMSFLKHFTTKFFLYFLFKFKKNT